ncbi:MAG: hypothetical protein INQ03_14075 [Candidatus Heimdallarchaeota archaeon]|nr:hypothetical protein [Candidatus Heimdallarchaeota archaeon]
MADRFDEDREDNIYSDERYIYSPFIYYYEDIEDHHPYETIYIKNKMEICLSGVFFDDILPITTLTELNPYSLILSGNQLTKIPFMKINGLYNLNLECNNISSIENLDLENLKNLNLNYNLVTNDCFKCLCEGNLPELLNLSLIGNNITEIPIEIENLRNLIFIDLGRNPIKENEIPNNIKKIIKENRITVEYGDSLSTYRFY